MKIRAPGLGGRSAWQAHGRAARRWMSGGKPHWPGAVKSAEKQS
jgi:hypothetical protein